MRVSFVFALALVLIVALQGCLVEGEERTFTFGISLALDAPPGQYFAGVQVETLHGITIWKEWWNSLSVAERTMKNGDSFKVELHIERFSNYTDLEVNKRALFNTYAAMFANTSIDFLFMPVASPWDIPFRNYSYYELGVPFTVGTQVDGRERNRILDLQVIKRRGGLTKRLLILPGRWFETLTRLWHQPWLYHPKPISPFQAHMVQSQPTFCTFGRKVASLRRFWFTRRTWQLEN